MERWVRSKIASTSSSWACSLATASASTWARADIGKEQITFCPLVPSVLSGNKSTHYVWGFWRPLDLFNPDQDGSNLIWKAPRVCENPCRCFSFDLTNAIKTEISQVAPCKKAFHCSAQAGRLSSPPAPPPCNVLPIHFRLITNVISVWTPENKHSNTPPCVVLCTIFFKQWGSLQLLDPCAWIFE